jgi:D-xylose 1-dehydrogenase (NADP+, D-xylono-1,5-lactone-forming)
MLAGEPMRVYAETVRGGTGVDARLVAVLRHTDGVISHLDCGLGDGLYHRLEVGGSEGVIVLPDPWLATEPSIEIWRDAECERIEVEPVDAYRLEVENLADAIRGGNAPLLGRADATAQARAVAALYTSAEQGRPIILAPA